MQAPVAVSQMTDLYSGLKRTTVTNSTAIDESPNVQLHVFSVRLSAELVSFCARDERGVEFTLKPQMPGFARYLKDGES